MKKYLLISIFILLQYSLLASNYYGKRISIENGLSQASVRCVQYDNNGTLWIGTRFGLNEYRNNKIRSFMSCSINNLYCDSENRLWVLTDKGVYRYNNLSDSFEQICNIAATCIYERAGIMYIGTHSGIATYDKSNGLFTEAYSEIWYDYCTILEYGDDIICVDRRQGIQVLGKSKRDISFLEGKTIMSACEYKGTLFICILGEGVFLYNIDNEDESAFYPSGKNGLSKDLILCCDVIDGQIWLGTDGNGIMVMNPENGTTKRLLDLITVNPGTEVPASVTCIYSDPLKTIWIGGESFGVTGLKQTSIVYYLPNSVINKIFISKDGKTYVGSDGQGLFRMDEGRPTSIKSTEGLKITSICDYDNDRLLVFAYNKGYYLINRHNGQKVPFIIIDRQTNAKECLYGNAPSSHALPDGRILLFAIHHYIHNPKNGSFALLTDNSNGNANDLQGIDGLWGDMFCYCKDGVFSIDTETMSLNQVYNSRDRGESINSMALTDSIAYIGTDNGLIKLNLYSGESIHIQNGLIKRVTELCYDNRGTLWVGADNSLSCFQQGSSKLIGENLGVPAIELLSSTVSNDGTVYMGGASGFVKIENDFHTFDEDESTKAIYLHDISLDGRTVSAKKGIVDLPYDFKNLGVRISVHGADPLEKIAYRYIVKGPSSFSFDSYEDRISIPTLKTGTYSVEVSYLQGIGQWSKPQIVVGIKVKNPWYTSTAMIIVYIVLFAGAMVGLSISMRSRMRKELQQEMRAKDFQFINKFEKYIEEHLEDSNLNVGEISSALAMSRATLYTKVKNAYSMGIGEYIEERRINKAKELLSNTNHSVAEIADKIGYSTPRYFSTRFKIKTGYSPLGYRKGHK